MTPPCFSLSLLPLRCLLLLLPWLALAGPAAGSPADAPAPAPPLEALFRLVGPAPSTDLDATAIEALLDFLASPAPGAFAPPSREGMPGTFHAFEVACGLSEVLAYGYAPDVPGQTLMPRSVRALWWLEVDGEDRDTLPDLQKRLEREEGPLVVRGLEHEESTPNLETGTYYAYDQYRTLILGRFRDQPYLVSLTRQRGRSDVGKKGAVLGEDSDWDYFYSGEKGLDRPLLGWVDSRIYGAESVTVFLQLDGSPARLRCATFKWLKAGWMGMNMVKARHIRQGLERYEKGFREVIEHPQLPPAQELAGILDEVNGLGEEALLRKTGRLGRKLLNEHPDAGLLAGEENARRLRSGAYGSAMTPGQRRALLYLEELSCRLGRGCLPPEPAGD